MALCLCLALGLQGCKREGCTDPLSTNYDPEAKADDGSCTYAQSTVRLRFTHMVGSEPFAFDSVYQTPEGRNYKFTAARFHLSSPVLMGEDGDLPLHQYLQVKADTRDYVLDTVDPGHYTGLRFDIGVDSATNHGDPTLLPDTHPLSLMNPAQDHWSWSGGYVFLKLEGRVDSTAAMTGAMDRFFFFHLASEVMRTPVTLASHFDLGSATEHTLSITIDWGQAFAGVDLRRASTQTTDNLPLAQQVMQNFVSAIEVE